MSNVAGRKLTWEEIGRRSAKVIGFTDLAGHEKYLRTTVFGLLSSEPNYCLLMVAANNGLVGMSKEHLGKSCPSTVVLSREYLGTTVPRWYCRRPTHYYTFTRDFPPFELN